LNEEKWGETGISKLKGFSVLMGKSEEKIEKKGK